MCSLLFILLYYFPVATKSSPTLQTMAYYGKRWSALRGKASGHLRRAQPRWKLLRRRGEGERAWAGRWKGEPTRPPEKNGPKARPVLRGKKFRTTGPKDPYYGDRCTPKCETVAKHSPGTKMSLTFFSGGRCSCDRESETRGSDRRNLSRSPVVATAQNWRRLRGLYI